MRITTPLHLKWSCRFLYQTNRQTQYRGTLTKPTPREIPDATHQELNGTRGVTTRTQRNPGPEDHLLLKRGDILLKNGEPWQVTNKTELKLYTRPIELHKARPPVPLHTLKVLIAQPFRHTTVLVYQFNKIVTLTNVSCYHNIRINNTTIIPLA